MKRHTNSRPKSLRALLGAPKERANGCRWFLLCDNPATCTVAHPILGSVPCCARCAAKANA